MNTPSVLIVEDHQDQRFLFTLMLRDCAYTIHTASDAFEAMKALQQHSPDLIILDLVLPEISGVELLRQIRSQKQFEHVKILILTASPNMAKGDAERMVNAILVKPLRRGELKETVNRILFPQPRLSMMEAV